jgi:hypothetical protein
MRSVHQGSVRPDATEAPHRLGCSGSLCCVPVRAAWRHLDGWLVLFLVANGARALKSRGKPLSSTRSLPAVHPHGDRERASQAQTNGKMPASFLVGPRAISLVLEMGARLEDVPGAIHAHPVRERGLQEAALKSLGSCRMFEDCRRVSRVGRADRDLPGQGDSASETFA